MNKENQSELDFYKATLRALQKIESDIKEAALMFSEQFEQQFKQYHLEGYKEYMLDNLYNEAIESIDAFKTEMHIRIRHLEAKNKNKDTQSIFKRLEDDIVEQMLRRNEVSYAIYNNILNNNSESWHNRTTN